MNTKNNAEMAFLTRSARVEIFEFMLTKLQRLCNNPNSPLLRESIQKVEDRAFKASSTKHEYLAVISNALETVENLALRQRAEKLKQALDAMQEQSNQMRRIIEAATTRSEQSRNSLIDSGIFEPVDPSPIGIPSTRASEQLLPFQPICPLQNMSVSKRNIFADVNDVPDRAVQHSRDDSQDCENRHVAQKTDIAKRVLAIDFVEHLIFPDATKSGNATEKRDSARMEWGSMGRVFPARNDAIDANDQHPNDSENSDEENAIYSASRESHLAMAKDVSNVHSIESENDKKVRPIDMEMFQTSDKEGEESESSCMGDTENTGKRSLKPDDRSIYRDAKKAKRSDEDKIQPS